jgi:hypothetical protein
MGLEWLTHLDWKRLRRIKMDPNWVAGGVLCILLFLLLLITVNRGVKTGATTEEADAPTWKSAASTIPSPSESVPATAHSLNATAAPADTQVHGESPPMTAGNSNAAVSPNLAAVESKATSNASSANTESGNRTQQPLAGIYYPRTPFPAPAIGAERSTIAPQSAHAAARSYGEELRTAQRDGLAPHAGARSTAPTQAPVGRAQFEGIITKP